MAKKQKKNFKRKSDFDNRPKYCKFTSLGIEEIDYKDIKLLKEYLTETGKILQEIQPGYMLGDRLLRPALVGVAKRNNSKNNEKNEQWQCKNMINK